MFIRYVNQIVGLFDDFTRITTSVKQRLLKLNERFIIFCDTIIEKLFILKYIKDGKEIFDFCV